MSVEIIRPQLKLKRYENGSDWGVERLLLARVCRAGSVAEVRVWWWTGHKSWFCVGQSAYYPGSIVVDWHNEKRARYEYQSLYPEKVGETRLARVLKSEIGREFLREQLKERVSHIIDVDELITAIEPGRTVLVLP